VKYGNRSKPGNEEWWYVPGEGRLLGYDKQSKLLVGSVGPDGFLPPDAPPGERFRGELAHASRFYLSQAAPYLAFPGGVYTVDFRALKVRTLFMPAAGETVLWANQWEDEKLHSALAVVGTDRSVHLIDEAGSQVIAAPLAYDLRSYQITHVGRLDDPRRYWVWYEPAWYLGVETLETMPAYVVEYDSAGREVSPRQAVLPRPGGVRNIVPPMPIVEPSSGLPLFGAATPPAEAVALAGTMRYLESDVQRNDGRETWLLLPFLLVTTQWSIPGVRWDPHAHLGLVFGYAGLMLLSAVVCALVCFLLARRYAFSRAGRVGWALCGLLFGPAGLLLMLALQEWPTRVACPGCRKPRLVTIDCCEHCGAPHAAPAPDGTEIFEETAPTRQAALAGRS
jgi:hypothetical protein